MDGREVGLAAVASTALDRLLGLMGRSELPGSVALWLPACGSVHTCFMRFPIDVVYVNAGSEVLRVVRGLRPWRISFGPRGARQTVELRAGDAEALQLHPGARLELC
ncbi:MAG: DUF192 domain-containing protein [Dehalococcoidia bacterium]